MAEGTAPKPFQEPVIRPYPAGNNEGTPLLTFISSLPTGVSYYYIVPSISIDGLSTAVTGERFIIFYKYNANLTDIVVFGNSNKIVKGRDYVGTLSWSSAFPA